MSIERQYYENEEFWTDALFYNNAERFETLASHIPAEARTLLDVGCGNGAFVNMLAEKKRFEEIHATDRSPMALKHVRTAKTEASVDALPFADRAYDIVTSLEMIEHLPLTVYEAGLANICRVARRFVLIGVPNEEDLEASFIACPSCRTRFNPDYHMRRFDKATMQTLLRPFGFKPRETFYMGGKNRYFLVTRLFERCDDFSVAVPCPVCGFTVLPRRPASSRSQSTASSAGGMAAITEAVGAKGLIKKLLHTRTEFRWVATLYERA
ncbi:MAG: class I SAM-dependent methyltransferase [Rhodomicrobium sp.]